MDKMIRADLEGESFMAQLFVRVLTRGIGEVLKKSKEAIPILKQRGGVDVNPYERAETHYVNMQTICEDVGAGKRDLKSGVQAVKRELDSVADLMREGLNSRSFYADTCLDLTSTLEDLFRDYLE